MENVEKKGEGNCAAASVLCLLHPVLVSALLYPMLEPCTSKRDSFGARRPETPPQRNSVMGDERCSLCCQQKIDLPPLNENR